jgi:hypothetical protein
MSNADKNAIAIIAIACGLSFVFYAYYLGLRDRQLHSSPVYLHFMFRSWPWYLHDTPACLQWLWW